jgi:hypothetical protein
MLKYSVRYHGMAEIAYASQLTASNSYGYHNQSLAAASQRCLTSAKKQPTACITSQKSDVHEGPCMQLNHLRHQKHQSRGRAACSLAS